MCRSDDYSKMTAPRRHAGGGNASFPPPPRQPSSSSPLPPLPSAERGKFVFRSLVPSDLVELRALHEDWFPVRYSQSFYECGA